MIRGLYRKTVPLPIRHALWRLRRAPRHLPGRVPRRVRKALLRLRYGDRKDYFVKPDSHSERLWRMETNAEHTMRGAWLKSVVRGTVLDVGCGNGYATCDMARAAEHIHAVDLNERLVRRTAELAELNGIRNVSFQQCDAYSLPFGDGFFDTVTLLEILEHLEHPERAVCEAIRVARQQVVVTVPAHGHMTNCKGHINDFSLSDLRGLFPGPIRLKTRKPFALAVYKKPGGL